MKIEDENEDEKDGRPGDFYWASPIRVTRPWRGWSAAFMPLHCTKHRRVCFFYAAPF